MVGRRSFTVSICALRSIICILLLLWGASIALASSPKLLIVQERFPKVKDLDPNLDITDYVAQAFDDEGRVQSVVWSLTDPVYRAALDAGKIQPGHAELSRDEAILAARALGCDYLLIVKARTLGSTLLVKGELFRFDKSIWKDPAPNQGGEVTDVQIEELYKSGRISKDDYNSVQQGRGYRHVSVSESGRFSARGTARSIARTWNELLKETAFRSLEAHHRLQEPEPSPGQVPKIVQDPGRAVDPAKAHETDNRLLFESVDAAIKAGRNNDAIMILREAVDAAPMDLARRRALVKQLSASGFHDQAAAEAVRASIVVPDKGAFKLAGAHAAISGGEYDLAQAQALEVLAKEPESPAPQVVLGEIALFRGQYSSAIERFNSAVDKGGEGEAFGYRAFTRAFMGDSKGSLEDWATATKAGFESALWLPLINKVAPEHFASLKAVLIKVAAKRPQDPEQLAQEVKSLRLSLEATARLLATIVPPKEHSKSHSRRVLAYQLLAQSIGEVDTMLPKTDDDAMADARINLGEALKQWDAAQALAKTE